MRKKFRSPDLPPRFLGDASVSLPFGDERLRRGKKHEPSAISH